MSEWDRRRVVKAGLQAGTLVALGGLDLALQGRTVAEATAWQIDPARCTQCGRCATHCVLTPSAVKCVHLFVACGYCALCGGYHRPNATAQDTAAENQLCPTGALRRRFIETPFFEYTVDESLCTACGVCVKGCQAFGNGSLVLQVRHDRCLSCNQCSIAAACPSDAFRRVPASRPSLLAGPGPEVRR